MTTSALAQRATAAPAVTSQPSPRVALETFVREGWHDEVQRRLAAKYGRACGSGLVEEAIGHALEKATSRLEACHGRQVYLFVLTAAENWLLDNSKGARRAQARGWAKRVDLTALDQLPDERNPGIAETLATRDGDAMREEIASALLHRLEADEVETLSTRVQLVMSLFHVQQLTKREIRMRTGLTVKQLRTALAAGNKFLHDEYLAIEARLEAGDCADAHDGVTRLIFNLAQGREARAARAHVRHCLTCAARVRQAEATRNALALLLPPTVAVPSMGIDNASVDQALGVIGHARAFANRLFTNVADLAQPASVSGVGRGISGPVGAGLMKAAALCLAGGGIAATCIGATPFHAPKTDTRAPSHHFHPAETKARSAQRPALARPISYVDGSKYPGGRTIVRKRKPPKPKPSTPSSSEFSSSTSASPVTTTQTRQPVAPAAPSSPGASEPAEFPIF